MSRWRRWAALGACALSIVAARGAAAQSIHLAISALPNAGDSISPAPVMVLSSIQADPTLAPYTAELALALDNQFQSPFLVRTTTADNATFTLDSLLIEKQTIYFRARLLDKNGRIVATEEQHHPVRSWIHLIGPARGTNDVIFTNTPTFQWDSPAITFPPGLWSFELTVFNTGTGATAFQATTNDLNFTMPQPLDACTSFSWQIVAQGSNSSGHTSALARSPGTFVLQTPDCPTATIFYQNFPNPFGGPGGAKQTCFWFDLAGPGRTRVRLAIYDIRLHHVRQIIPGTVGDGNLKGGPYGRQPEVAQTDCTPGFEWDGRDDAGRLVPPGVYKAIFDADGVHTVKTILYKGP